LSNGTSPLQLHTNLGETKAPNIFFGDTSNGCGNTQEELFFDTNFNSPTISLFLDEGIITRCNNDIVSLVPPSLASDGNELIDHLTRAMLSCG